MMQEKFKCVAVRKNNGIRQIHLTGDVYRNADSQPTEFLINAPTGSPFSRFHEGATYFIQATEIIDNPRKPSPHTGQ